MSEEGRYWRVTLSAIFRAVMLGEENGVFGTLRDFLFRLGMRGTTQISDVEELKDFIERDTFPVLFIDNSPGSNDGYLLFERFRREFGLELIPFFFMTSDQDRSFVKNGGSLGATGAILKPFNPKELTLLMMPISSMQLRPSHQKALGIAKAMCRGQMEAVIKPLTQLQNTPHYAGGSRIALSRICRRLSRFDLAEKKLAEMLKSNPDDLRAFCEVADFYRATGRFKEASRIFKKITQTDPKIRVKIYEQIDLLINMGDLNEAAVILSRMLRDKNSAEPALTIILRLMSALGLESLCPEVARPYPSIAKHYPTIPKEGVK